MISPRDLQGRSALTAEALFFAMCSEHFSVSFILGEIHTCFVLGPNKQPAFAEMQIICLIHTWV